jgi:hypothetical protein
MFQAQPLELPSLLLEDLKLLLEEILPYLLYLELPSLLLELLLSSTLLLIAYS